MNSTDLGIIDRNAMLIKKFRDKFNFSNIAKGYGPEPPPGIEKEHRDPIRDILGLPETIDHPLGDPCTSLSYKNHFEILDIKNIFDAANLENFHNPNRSKRHSGEYHFRTVVNRMWVFHRKHCL